MASRRPSKRESLAEFASRCCPQDVDFQSDYERAVLDLRWCLYRKLGGTPEYRDLRLLARVGDWRNEADCTFAHWVTASGKLPCLRWERVPDGRIRFAGMLPRPPSEAPDSGPHNSAESLPFALRALFDAVRRSKV